jgi:uncharacterized delta-60 repeat protein
LRNLGVGIRLAKGDVNNQEMEIMKTNQLLQQRSRWPRGWLLLSFAIFATNLGTRAAPGDVDPSFDPGSCIDGQVIACAIQPDGKVLIGGYFNTLHNAVRGKVARLNTDGRNDETFMNGLSGLNSDGNVQCLALQPDGKVIIGGLFSSVNGFACTNLARLNADGTLDTNFSSGLTWQDGILYEINTICLQHDGKLLIGGWFDSVNGFAKTNFARLNSDGSLDESFNVILTDASDPLNPYNGLALTLALQEDGKILVGGDFTQVNGWPCTNLVRLDQSGAVDAGFQVRLAQADWLGCVQCLAIQPDHQIVVGGYFTGVNGLALTNLARFNPDGSLDESFYCPQLDPAQNPPYQVVPFPGGKLIALGAFTPDGSNYCYTVLLNTNGHMDFTFTNESLPFLNVVAVQADGKLIIGGGLGEPWLPRDGIARLNSDWSLDSSFDNGEPSGIGGVVTVLATQGDGKILIGGNFLSSINDQPLDEIARLNSDASLDDSFNVSLNGDGWPWDRTLNVIKVLGDEKILLAGAFGSVNGVTRHGLARVNSDGTLDESFLNNLSGPDAEILDACVQPNGQILVAGNFQNFNGQPRYHLARLNADGTLDSSFANEFFGNDIRKLAVQADGKILIVVYENQFAKILRANSDGTIDGSFSTHVEDGIYNYYIYQVLIQPDGKILLCGFLNHGSFMTGVVRLNPDGTLDPTFLLTDFASVSVVGIGLQNDGKIVAIGDFESTNGYRWSGAVQFFSDGSVDTNLIADSHFRTPVRLALQPDGKILIGGDISAINQTARKGLAKLMGNCIPPAIRFVPQTSTGENNAGIHLGVAATGFPAPQYQWFFNGTNAIVGATNRILSLDNLQFDQTGFYTVVISNAGGCVTTMPAALNVIAAVPRRAVPALQLAGDPGSTLHLESLDQLLPAANWSPLTTVNLDTGSQYQFDTSLPLPPQRFYRAWQTGLPAVTPSITLDFVPALTLTGALGNSVQVDGINVIGPTNAWFNIDTVTLTNTTQLYFDVSAIRQPARLYRLVQLQ